MENTETLHSSSERFIGHFDVLKALIIAVVKRKKANKLFVFNQHFQAGWSLLSEEPLLSSSLKPTHIHEALLTFDAASHIFDCLWGTPGTTLSCSFVLSFIHSTNIS